MITNKNHIPKILFIGLDNSGKSTIIEKLKDYQNEEKKEIYPTAFINYAKLILDGKEIFVVEISGSLRYRDHWKTFYSQVDGIVFVIDGSDISRALIVKELISDMFTLINEKIPVSILVNKSDKEECENKSSFQNFLELDFLPTKFKWEISNSIGYSCFGVKEALKFILSKIFIS